MGFVAPPGVEGVIAGGVLMAVFEVFGERFEEEGGAAGTGFGANVAGVGVTEGVFEP